MPPVINTIRELCRLGDNTFICDVINYNDICQLIFALSME